MRMRVSFVCKRKRVHRPAFLFLVCPATLLSAQHFIIIVVILLFCCHNSDDGYNVITILTILYNMKFYC